MAKKIDFGEDDTIDKGEKEAIREVAKEPDPTKDPVVDLDSIDDDSPAEREDKPSKGSRYWRNQQEREADQRRLAQLEGELSQTRQQQAQWIQDQQRFLMQTSQNREQAKDPIDAEVDSLRNKVELIHREHEVKRRSNSLTDEEHQRLTKELHDTELQLIDKRAEKIFAQRMPQQANHNPAAAALKAHIDMTYPDVAGNPNAIKYATAWEMTEIAQGRQPTVEQIMNQARTVFRTGPRGPNAPRERDPTLRDRYAGVPRGAQGGDSPRQFTMTKEMRKMADQRYSHVADQKKRYEMFAKMQTKDDD